MHPRMHMYSSTRLFVSFSTHINTHTHTRTQTHTHRVTALRHTYIQAYRNACMHPYIEHRWVERQMDGEPAAAVGFCSSRPCRRRESCRCMVPAFQLRVSDPGFRPYGLSLRWRLGSIAYSAKCLHSSWLPKMEDETNFSIIRVISRNFVLKYMQSQLK